MKTVIDKHTREVKHHTVKYDIVLAEDEELVDFIPDQVNPNQQIENALDVETENYIKRVNDGINAYARISAEFRMAKLSGQISEEQHHSVEVVLIPVRNEVLAGQWISAKIQLEQIGSSIIGETLYNRLHTQISNYINENY